MSSSVMQIKLVFEMLKEVMSETHPDNKGNHYVIDILQLQKIKHPMLFPEETWRVEIDALFQ